MFFPKCFPKGCPPENARPEALLSYRLCNNNPINKDDFLSYHELGIPFNGMEGFGISVFTDINEIKVINELPNHRRKNSFVAEGITVPCCGVVLETFQNRRKSHLTWWLFESAQPHKYFHVWEGENGKIHNH